MIIRWGHNPLKQNMLALISSWPEIQQISASENIRKKVTQISFFLYGIRRQIIYSKSQMNGGKWKMT